MRSRKKQYTVDCREVHQRVGAVVQQHVRLEDQGYKCRASVLLRACKQIVSPICGQIRLAGAFNEVKAGK